MIKKINAILHKQVKVAVYVCILFLLINLCHTVVTIFAKLEKDVIADAVCDYHCMATYGSTSMGTHWDGKHCRCYYEVHQLLNEMPVVGELKPSADSSI